MLLPRTSVACDEAGRVPLTFLSHAGVRTRAGRILASRETVILSGRRERGASDVTPRQGVPFSLGDLDVTLVDSGYLPGSSHLVVDRPDGGRTLYASRLGPGASPPPGRFDTLVLDPRLADVSLAGRPGGEGRLLTWIDATLSTVPVAVLHVEVPAMLLSVLLLAARTGARIATTRSVAAWARRHREAGADLPAVIDDVGGSPAGTVALRALRPGRPVGRNAAVVVDAGDLPAAGASTVIGLAHAAGLDEYERLVVGCRPGVVHLGRGMESLPGRVGGSVRWVMPEAQMRLG